ncbi:hypothetical protein CPC08DRAFT_707861, partial [Agrocybe pediades]
MLLKGASFISENAKKQLRDLKTNFRKNPFISLAVMTPFIILFQLLTIRIFLDGPLDALILLFLEILYLTVFILKIAIWVPWRAFSFIFNNIFLYLSFALALWVTVAVALLAITNGLTQLMRRKLSFRKNKAQPATTPQPAEGPAAAISKSTNPRSTVLNLLIISLRFANDTLVSTLSLSQSALSKLENVVETPQAASDGNRTPTVAYNAERSKD